jgi:integrase
MAGRQAKILSKDNADDLLVFASTTQHPLRNRLIVLLSVKAGLRAAEIANLTWAMVLTPSAEIGPAIELHDRVAKKSGGRLIPIHPELRSAGAFVQADRGNRSGHSFPTRWTDDTGQHRQLVCRRLSRNRLARLFIAFWPPHVHHPSRPAGPQCWCLTARCSTSRRSSFDTNHSAVYRW